MTHVPTWITGVWRRLIDVKPPRATPDEGRLTLRGRLLLEHGVHAPYVDTTMPPQALARLFSCTERFGRSRYHRGYVPPIPGTFVVNIGDMMEAWTNGRFVATAHRVQSPPVERFSFPLFCAVDYGTVVAPLPCCIGRGERPRYAPRIAGEHLLAQTMRTFRYLREALAAGALELPESARTISPFGRKPGPAS